MPDTAINTGSILKNDPAFAGLDFSMLRAEGISYLAKLSGKVWTDHNVHDPGITILELLCYALIDLGYRSRIPAAHLFSRNPDDKTEDDNFYTPARILSCNPVTILDFRKLLMDIPAVKNAWLVPQQEWHACNTDVPLQNAGESCPGQSQQCSHFLNGLYNVYVELYKGPNAPYEQLKPSEKQHIENVVTTIRNVLMAHRNLCEDFVSITVLCKEKIGVCAEIDLAPAADAEKVYLNVLETLRSFFSPDPQYFTLPELIDQGKSIEDIFAGRPYLEESHGFVDTAALEGISLRKEIHVSDVYDALFRIEGVRNIRRLRLQGCSNDSAATFDHDWKYRLKKDHTAEFSLECSAFRFSKGAVPVLVNEKKYRDLFNLNYSLSGKVLHKKQFDALDFDIPKGIYHEDLDKYYSIQNDMPRVYGISEGGLPDTAPKHRKAQALQLRGYLLFFDQLLANYLSQLSHLRNLFALKNKADNQQTYFSALPKDVPDIQRLLRFGTDAGLGSIMGDRGVIHALPVDRTAIDDLIAQGTLNDADIGSLETITFPTAADRDAALYTVIESLQSGLFTVNTVQNNPACWFFYIYTSSDDVALVSNRYYSSEKDAHTDAANVTYIGTFVDNYYRYTAKDAVSSGFHLELNMAGYPAYLQKIVEDKQLYAERRAAFLDHLLARFAESFTDFALLSFSITKEQELKSQEQKKKSSFLAAYDQLGRDRGKAYDYKRNGWNNGNVSGFEKRVKAFAGMDESCGDTLCNFEVVEYAGQNYWEISSAGQTIFRSPAQFDSNAEALADLKAFLSVLPEKESFLLSPVPFKEEHTLVIKYNDQRAEYLGAQGSREQMEQAGEQLRKLAKAEITPNEADIVASHHIYKLHLLNDSGKTILSTRQTFDTEPEAMSAAKQALKKINDEDWELPAEVEGTRPQLNLISSKNDRKLLLDFSQFETVVEPCPEEFHWYLPNSAGDNLLSSSNTYTSQRSALESFIEELTSETFDRNNIRLSNENGYRFELLRTSGSVLGLSTAFPDDATRNNAIDFVLEFCRKESADKQFTFRTSEAWHWQVTFSDGLQFRSDALLADEENAQNSWRREKKSFRNAENYIWTTNPDGKRILSVKNENDRIIAKLENGTTEESSINDLARRIQNDFDNKTARTQFIRVDEGYGFRMVDNASILLSGYEVYASRGDAFLQLLRALNKASDEHLYIRSGDEGNHEYTFLLKIDESGALAEHPTVYDTQSERDEALARTIRFAEQYTVPAKAIKDNVCFSYRVLADGQGLFRSVQRFSSKDKAKENATHALTQAASEENYAITEAPYSGTCQVILMSGEQQLAALARNFENLGEAGDARNNIVQRVRAQTYRIGARPFPNKWKFSVSLGFYPWHSSFLSTTDFDNKDSAVKAYEKMAADIARADLQPADDSLILVSKHKLNNAKLSAALTGSEGDAERALSATKTIKQLLAPDARAALSETIKQDKLADQGPLMYRVVRKDEFLSYYLSCRRVPKTPKKLLKEASALGKVPHNYLRICFGDDIILERKDAASGETFFHYMLQAGNRYYSASVPANEKKELILFISKYGYSTRDEARDAFNSVYLPLLKLAGNTKNYGPGKTISLEKIIRSPRDPRPAADPTIVYVPEDTLAYYNNDSSLATKELAELAKSYPIRVAGRKGYKYLLYNNKPDDVAYLISTTIYDSPEEAMRAFYFFLALAKERKNFYLHCVPDTGKTFVVVKEVLLESNSRYQKDEQLKAWGSEGIEKLIGVSQKAGSFHIYEQNCCFSFFVACKGKVIHPCVYDTAVARDRARQRLIDQFANYTQPELPEIKVSSDGNYYEVKYEGTLVAMLPIEGENSQNGICNRKFFRFVEWILALAKADARTEKRNDAYIFVLYQDEREAVVMPATATSEPELTKERDEWLSGLVRMALRFPFYQRDNLYYFRIYNNELSDENDDSAKDDCGCNKPPIPEPADCAISWIGGCFSTCEEAIEAFKSETFLQSLKSKDNYRSVLDCTCGAYRIELIDDSEIIAVNPQCYASPEMVCAAVERTAAAINCEGMHMVEHILLRPQAGCDDHCKCLIPACPDETCFFKWEGIGEKDPCIPAANDPCFVPGLDPYSCIATVVLPAWSNRFKSQESRDILNRIFYREAPSHIMLRILWLSPQEFCQFETMHRTWLSWLAAKTSYCGPAFDQCKFIQLLFSEPLGCWWPAEQCEPCNSVDRAARPSCDDSDKKECDCHSLSINDVYCWSACNDRYEHPPVKLQPKQEERKLQLIRQRAVGDKKTLQHLLGKYENDQLLRRAFEIVNKPETPAQKKITEVIKELGTTLFEEGDDKRAAYNEAARTLINFYLDRVLLDKYDPKQLSRLNTMIENARPASLNLREVLDNWTGPEINSFIHKKTLGSLQGIFSRKFKSDP